MPLPDLNSDGFLPPGIHAASLRETLARHGDSSQARQKQGNLLRLIVEAAQSYPSIKRVLVWGSFVTAKPEPNDLDYSILVGTKHRLVEVAAEHRRFFVPSEARQFYGVDVNYLVIYDYPLGLYIERTDFICQRRDKLPCGIVEISLRGEFCSEAEVEAK